MIIVKLLVALHLKLKLHVVIILLHSVRLQLFLVYGIQVRMLVFRLHLNKIHLLNSHVIKILLEHPDGFLQQNLAFHVKN